MYAGGLKREQPLVQDVVEAVRGLGEQTAPAVYTNAGVARRARLVDLADKQRDRLSQAIAATLGIRVRRKLTELLDDEHAEAELPAQ